MSNNPIGKRIGDNIWIHKDSSTHLPKEVLQQIEGISDIDFEVIRFDRKSFEVTIIESPDWNTSHEPIVGDSYKIVNGKPILSSKKNEKNPLIYHHKWMMVDKNNAGFDYQESIDRSKSWEDKKEIFLEEQGISKREFSSKIGRLNYWEEFLRHTKLENRMIQGDNMTPELKEIETLIEDRISPLTDKATLRQLIAENGDKYLEDSPLMILAKSSLDYVIWNLSDFYLNQKYLSEEQQITSENTSIHYKDDTKKLPRATQHLKKSSQEGVIDLTGKVIYDHGTGRSEHPTMTLNKEGAAAFGYDPFHKGWGENIASQVVTMNGQSDYALCSNVLCVQKEIDLMAHSIAQLMNSVKSKEEGGIGIIAIYEKNGDGIGEETSKGWQNNLKKSFYKEMISHIVGKENVKIEKDLIQFQVPKEIKKELKVDNGILFNHEYPEEVIETIEGLIDSNKALIEASKSSINDIIKNSLRSSTQDSKSKPKI